MALEFLVVIELYRDYSSSRDYRLSNSYRDYSYSKISNSFISSYRGLWIDKMKAKRHITLQSVKWRSEQKDSKHFAYR